MTIFVTYLLEFYILALKSFKSKLIQIWWDSKLFNATYDKNMCKKIKSL